jgi:peptidoglycan L-alanyl-D-glutamate endopeptidase CwlK
MSRFKLSTRSRSRLNGVKPALIGVVERAITLTRVDFGVISGVRTPAEQARLVASGASTTHNSKHLTGDAVDVMAYVGPQGRWELPLYYTIAEAFRDAASQLGVRIRWGGAWVELKPGMDPKQEVKAYVLRRQKIGREAFIDAGHVELV